jgi:hypothetical protein
VKKKTAKRAKTSRVAGHHAKTRHAATRKAVHAAKHASKHQRVAGHGKHAHGHVQRLAVKHTRRQRFATHKLSHGGHHLHIARTRHH